MEVPMKRSTEPVEMLKSFVKTYQRKSNFECQAVESSDVVKILSEANLELERCDSLMKKSEAPKIIKPEPMIIKHEPKTSRQETDHNDAAFYAVVIQVFSVFLGFLLMSSTFLLDKFRVLLWTGMELLMKKAIHEEGKLELRNFPKKLIKKFDAESCALCLPLVILFLAYFVVSIILVCNKILTMKICSKCKIHV